MCVNFNFECALAQGVSVNINLTIIIMCYLVSLPFIPSIHASIIIMVQYRCIPKLISICTTINIFKSEKIQRNYLRLCIYKLGY